MPLKTEGSKMSHPPTERTIELDSCAYASIEDTTLFTASEKKRLNEMKGITEKQRNYIRILSSYPSTRKKDKENIQTFLKFKGKTSLKDLTTEEASKLIQILLSYPAEYSFRCGLKCILQKREINRYNVLGELEGCLHACPDKQIGDVHDCPFWIQEMETMKTQDKKEKR